MAQPSRHSASNAMQLFQRSILRHSTTAALQSVNAVITSAAASPGSPIRYSASSQELWV